MTSIAPGVQPVVTPGGYVSCHSHDGQLLAVAVNQEDVHSSRMMYVSPWLEAVVVADMKGLGTRAPVSTNARSAKTPAFFWL